MTMFNKIFVNHFQNNASRPLYVMRNFNTDTLFNLSYNIKNIWIKHNTKIISVFQIAFIFVFPSDMLVSDHIDLQSGAVFLKIH